MLNSHDVRQPRFLILYIYIVEKSAILSFRKIEIKILSTDNVEIYSCAKSQQKIRNILVRTKKKNLQRF